MYKALGGLVLSACVAEGGDDLKGEWFIAATGEPAGECSYEGIPQLQLGADDFPDRATIDARQITFRIPSGQYEFTAEWVVVDGAMRIGEAYYDKREYPGWGHVLGSKWAIGPNGGMNTVLTILNPEGRPCRLSVRATR